MRVVSEQHQSNRNVKWMWALLALLAFTGAVFFACLIMDHVFDYYKSGTKYAELRQNIYIESSSWHSEDHMSATVFNDDSTQPTAALLQYTPPVDIVKLRAINQDLVGWIRIADSAIDYPVVQGSDNAYYLANNFFREKSKSGCLFLDTRAVSDFSSKNNLIYGHNMKDGSMLGSLLSYLDKPYLDKHSEIVLYGLLEGYNLVPFAVYTDTNRGEYLECEFVNEAAYKNWLNLIIEKSIIQLGVFPDGTDHVITLVSCQAGFRDRRVVLHLVMRPDNDSLRSESGVT
jgi:sortase B